MNDVKWIKLSTNIFDDEKIMAIETMPEGFSILVVWLKLLALAGKSNNNGVFMLTDKIAYTDTMLSAVFRMKETIVRLALSTFQSLGMIDVIENTITIPNWFKYQNTDTLETIREKGRLRTQRYRERQRLLAEESKDENCNVISDITVPSKRISISSSISPSNVPSPSNVSKSLERDNITVNNNIKERRKKQFVPPTLEEVKAYCQQRGNKVDAQRFFDYYESGKWTDREGKPVVNWKQKMIANWEKKAEEQEASRPQTVRPKYKKLD